jgi:predicted amidophosphoribosyltransferase
MVAELDVLVKTCCAGQQAKTASRGAREINMKDAFSLQYPERIKGKHVVIIDDVVTTGETMKVARALLKKAGAKKVIGIAVAH